MNIFDDNMNNIEERGKGGGWITMWVRVEVENGERVK